MGLDYADLRSQRKPRERRSKHYTWNARNQLAAFGSTSFNYDSSGRRTRNAAGTSFLYDGLNPVQELSGGSVTANLLTGMGVDEIFARTDSAGTRSFLADALGSILALTDSAGTMQTQYTYERFGKTMATGSASSSTSQAHADLSDSLYEQATDGNHMRLTQTVWQLIRLISLSARVGLCVGFGIGLLVLLYGSRMNSWMVFILCPTSIVGIGLDNAPPIIAIGIATSMILIGNTVWYGVLFGVAGVLLKKTPPSVGSTR